MLMYSSNVLIQLTSTNSTYQIRPRFGAVFGDFHQALQLLHGTGRLLQLDVVAWSAATSATAGKVDAENNGKYFTSCDPHHDIYPFCYWQIFWHSIWHISDKIIEKTNLNICWKLEMEILKTFEFSNARVSFLQRLCSGTCAEHLELSTEQGACAAASATQWQLATHLVAPGSLKLGNMACLANEFASTF